ncbi:MAG: pilus assembly protein PilM [Agathobacter sp.]|nr:pilus assembly protein PilM [Agathobacter sp.]
MPKVLCMEVGTSMVRVAEVNKMPNKVEILRTHSFDMPDDATKDGKVRLSDGVIGAIRDGLDESGIKAEDVYFAVDSTKILFKQVEYPYLARKSDITSMLTATFSDIFPVDDMLYHISYELEKVYEKNGQKMMSLDVYAIPNDLSESYYNLAVALGLNAKGLTDTSKSMAALFKNSLSQRNVAMVNINETTSTLSIYLKSDLVFSKTIPYGVANAINQIISSELTQEGISMTNAAEMLYTQNILLRHLPKGLLEKYSPEDKLRYDVTSSIVSLVKTIESAFSAFLSKNNIPISELQLSGLGAGFAGISQLLASEFEIPVFVMQQDPKTFTVNEKAADEPLLLSHYPSVGAVLSKVNFFTPEERAGGEVARNKKIDKWFIEGAVLIAVVAAGFSAFKYFEAKTAETDAKAENTRLDNKVQNLVALGIEDDYALYNAALSYNEEIKKLYGETTNGNEDMVDFLNELESILPPMAAVRAIEITPTNSHVTFVCDDKFVAAGVIHLLRNMQTINSFDCSGVAEDREGKLTFSADFTLKNSAEKEYLNGDPNEEGEFVEGDETVDNGENEGGETTEPTEPETPTPDTTTPEDTQPEDTIPEDAPANPDEPTEEVPEDNTNDENTEENGVG